jgi:multiple sugar transport system ATP-binding protein
MARVTFDKVVKKYGDSIVVKGLDLELPDGAFTVLVGPSGCGKTTTLRMIAGLEDATSGTIRIGDKDVTRLEPKDRDIAMVFQNYALYPHLNVRENLAFPLRAIRVNRAEALARADAVAETMGLTALLDRKPKDLSGGQQQRVAIGRAIIREPAVFLFDEPLSNLDAKLRVEMRTELLQLQRRLGITSLFVTHDQEEAMTLSDFIVVMRDGEIAQQGKPKDVYDKPNSTFVASFVGSPKMNLIEGTSKSGVFTATSGFNITAKGVPAGKIILGVRPDDIILDPAAKSSTHGRVGVIELLGPRAIVQIDTSGHSLTAVVEASRMAGIVEGADVGLDIRPGSVHLFDVESGLRIEA